MSFFSGWGTQSQTKKQEQTVDQNYASSTFFMGMSCLEQIQQAYQGNKGAKEFERYDHCDYSSKSIPALKSQLQTQLSLIEASMEGFSREYGKGSYKLPKNYNEGQVVGRLVQFHEFFKKQGDEQCVLMCQDFCNMVQGNKVKMNYKAMTFKDANRGEEKGKMVNKYVNATNLMHQEGVMVRSKGPNYRPEDVQFKHNDKYEDPYKKGGYNYRHR